MRKFMAIVCATFFFCVNPVSTSANPACMNITRNPVIRVHIMLMAILLCPSAFPMVDTVLAIFAMVELTAAKLVSLALETVSNTFVSVVSISLMVPVAPPFGSCACSEDIGMINRQVIIAVNRFRKKELEVPLPVFFRFIVLIWLLSDKKNVSQIFGS